jgi:hypothetical protein
MVADTSEITKRTKNTVKAPSNGVTSENIRVAGRKGFSTGKVSSQTQKEKYS